MVRLGEFAPPPTEESGDGVEYGWFVEDLERPGQWESYNKESSERLEQAFLTRKTTCQVVLRKYMFTVNLQDMQQMPNTSSGAPVGSQVQRVRMVKRARVETYTDPQTGETKRREARKEVVDPFAEGEADAAGIVDAVHAPGRAGPPSASDSTFPQLICVCKPHQQAIYTLELTPPEAVQSHAAKADGRGGVLALTAGRDGRVLEWNVDSGALVTEYKINSPTPKTSVLNAVYSPKGSFVIAGCDDKLARVYTVGKSAPLHTLEGHTHKVYGVGILAGEQKAATAGMDSCIRLWDLETGSCERVEVAQSSNIFNLKVSQNDPNLGLTVGDDTLVCVHDFRQPHSVVLRLVGHTRTLWDCALRPDDTQFATCGMDNTVRLWDPRSSTDALAVLNHHTRPVHSVRYMPQGRGVLSSSKDLSFVLCNTTTMEPVWQATAHQSSVFRVAYHADRDLLVSSAADAMVHEWRWKDGRAW